MILSIASVPVCICIVCIVAMLVYWSAWALACVIVVSSDLCWLGGSDRPDHINLQITQDHTAVLQIQIAHQLIG